MQTFSKNRLAFAESMHVAIENKSFMAAMMVEKAGSRYTITAEFLHKGEWEWRVNSVTVSEADALRLLDESSQY